MLPEVFYDAANEVLRIKFTEIWDENDVPEFFSRIRKSLEGRPKRFILGDVSQARSQRYSKQMRKIVAEETINLELEKVAIMGANPVLRMMAKVLLAAMQNKIPLNAKFFKTEEEALVWLKEP